MLPTDYNRYCTVTTMAYLPRALVLHKSIAERCPDFHLWVGCLEPGVKATLDAMALPGLSTIDLPEVEEHDPALLEVKPTRRLVEYIGTMRPSLLRLIMERHPDVELLTLLGSDLRFFRDPAPLFEELGDGSTMFAPHRFVPSMRAYLEGIYGPYNGDWITFRRSDEGLEALRWFRERTIEWCFLRLEEGKYNDQRYLDHWPERYPGTRVIEHLGAGLAPWNASQYRLERRGGELFVEGVPLIFYHYATMELFRGITTARRAGLMRGTYRYSSQPMPLVWRRAGRQVGPNEIELVWEPYVREVGDAILEVRRLEPAYTAGFGDGRADARRRFQTAVVGRLRKWLQHRRRGIRQLTKRRFKWVDHQGKRLDRALRRLEAHSAPRDRHLEPPA